VKVTGQPVELGIKRGPQSWAYFYMVLALILGIAIAIISVLDIPGLAKAVVIGAVSIAIIVIIIADRRVQNLLLRFKSSYEDKVRY
jgi:hypothetical protein